MDATCCFCGQPIEDDDWTVLVDGEPAHEDCALEGDEQW